MFWGSWGSGSQVGWIAPHVDVSRCVICIFLLGVGLGVWTTELGCELSGDTGWWMIMNREPVQGKEPAVKSLAILKVAEKACKHLSNAMHAEY